MFFFAVNVSQIKLPIRMFFRHALLFLMLLVGSGFGRFPVNTYYRSMRTHIYGTFMADTYVYESGDVRTGVRTHVSV
jgi:hypothetical protein